MRILLLTPDIPYPSESGAAIRNFGIIRGLSDAGHKVTLLTFRDRETEFSSNPLARYCRAIHSIPLPKHSKRKRILSLLTSRNADMETRLYCEAFAQKLAHLLAQETFDVIQFSGIETGAYLPAILAGKGTAKVVYDALNAEAELQRMIVSVDKQRPTRWHAAIYSAIQARRLNRFEGEICRAVDATIAVSEEDRVLLRKHGGAPVAVMPNGIAAEDYATQSISARSSDILVFTGKMDYRPNVDAMLWFAESVMPLLLKKRPAIKLVVVGRNPHHRIQDLAHTENIKITGRVDSVAPYLQSASLFILPMRMGSGTRLKILEAMASGCALVSTSLGASGLEKSMLEAIAIADDADSFARCVVSLLDDEEGRRDMGKRAQELVRANYDWPALMPRLLNAYKDIGLG